MSLTPLHIYLILNLTAFRPHFYDTCSIYASNKKFLFLQQIHDLILKGLIRIPENEYMPYDYVLYIFKNTLTFGIYKTGFIACRCVP